jgi:hypothetical protein
MKKLTRWFAPFRFIVLALTLFGCASAVDDAGLPSSDEAPASASEALKGAAAPVADVALNEDAADCDAAASPGAADSEEVSAILQSSLDDSSLQATGSLCRRMCNCCRGGNRFCCSHCRFCSGPIGPYGVSLEAQAP